MKRLLSLSLALLLAGTVRAAEPPILGVLKFQDETGAMPFQGGAGRALTNMLTNELAARGSFTVVERQKLRAVLEEQDLVESGRITPGQGAEIGKLIGADYLVTFTEEKYSMINAKTYDYLAVKRPVLVVPGDNDLLSNLVQDLNAGESLADVENIKSFLHQAVLRKRRSQPIEPYPLNEEKAMFYTRRNQTGRLAEVIRQCFASR
jgi:hypothetical protein